MFDSQIMRLLREDWPTAKLLADELFAMFAAWNERGLDGPLVIRLPEEGTEPALQVRGWEPGDILIGVRGRGGLGVGDLELTLGGLELSGADEARLPAGARTPAASGSGNAYVGTVVSGSGASYQVTLSPGGATVSVTVPGIDAGETVAAGTEAVVIDVGGGTYKMLGLPLWQA